LSAGIYATSTRRSCQGTPPIGANARREEKRREKRENIGHLWERTDMPNKFV
jgi:hypothetical protein